MTITLSIPIPKLKRLEKRAHILGVSSQSLAESVLEQLLNKSDSEFESWIETMEILSDKKMMKAVHQSGKDIAHHRSRSWEEYKNEMGL